MKGRCTFCEELLDGSEEHILLSAIGGRKRSRRVICGGHNNELGSTIDRALTDQLAFCSNALAIRTGRNEEAPTVRGLQTTDGVRVDLAPGGRPVQKAKIEDVSIGENRRQIRITANSEEQLRDLALTYMKKYGPGHDLMQNSTIEQVITPPSAPIDLRFQIGGPEPFRSVAKMGLLLLASETGTDAVRLPNMSGIRTFITTGGDSTAFVRQDYATCILRPPAFAVLPEHAHCICALTSVETGVAVAHVELFGTFRFTVLLSEAWRGPEVALFYGVDPITGEDFEVRTTDKPSLSVGEFHALPSSTDEALKPRIRRLFKMISERQSDVVMEAIAAQAIAEVFTADRRGTVITADDRARLANLMASLFVAHQHRIPYRKQLDLRRVFRPASGQTPGSRRRRKKW